MKRSTFPAEFRNWLDAKAVLPIATMRPVSSAAGNSTAEGDGEGATQINRGVIPRGRKVLNVPLKPAAVRRESQGIDLGAGEGQPGRQRRDAGDKGEEGHERSVNQGSCYWMIGEVTFRPDCRRGHVRLGKTARINDCAPARADPGLIQEGQPRYGACPPSRETGCSPLCPDSF